MFDWVAAMCTSNSLPPSITVSQSAEFCKNTEDWTVWDILYDHWPTVFRDSASIVSFQLGLHELSSFAISLNVLNNACAIPSPKKAYHVRFTWICNLRLFCNVTLKFFSLTFSLTAVRMINFLPSWFKYSHQLLDLAATNCLHLHRPPCSLNNEYWLSATNLKSWLPVNSSHKLLHG